MIDCHERRSRAGLALVMVRVGHSGNVRERREGSSRRGLGMNLARLGLATSSIAHTTHHSEHGIDALLTLRAMPVIPVPNTRQNHSIPMMTIRSAHSNAVSDGNSLGVPIRASRRATLSRLSEYARGIVVLSKRRCRARSDLSLFRKVSSKLRLERGVRH